MTNESDTSFSTIVFSIYRAHLYTCSTRTHNYNTDVFTLWSLYRWKTYFVSIFLYFKHQINSLFAFLYIELRLANKTFTLVYGSEFKEWIYLISKFITKNFRSTRSLSVLSSLAERVLNELLISRGDCRPSSFR
jgi:hypothetical protein